MSADRYVIVEVKLTPEERASLRVTQEEAQHPYIKKHLPRTEEIREEAERIKDEKRSLTFDGSTDFDGGRKKIRKVDS